MPAYSKNGNAYLPKIIVLEKGKRIITATMRPKSSFLGFIKQKAAINQAWDDIKRYGYLDIPAEYIIKHH